MATATPSQPSSDDAARIVGERLETDLVDAGLERPAARAIHSALELIVLRLLLVVATKQDLLDVADSLRREFTARSDQQDRTTAARFDQQERATAARFEQQERSTAARFDQQDRAIAELRRDLRWGFGLIIAILIAVLTTLITLLANGS